MTGFIARRLFLGLCAALVAVSGLLSTGGFAAAEKIKVEVGRPNLEFEKLDLDEKMLSKIAAEAHGRYRHITTAGQIVYQLDSTLRKRTEPKKIELYWPTFYWMFFVGVVTIEWVMRRRFQLR